MLKLLFLSIIIYSLFFSQANANVRIIRSSSNAAAFTDVAGKALKGTMTSTEVYDTLQALIVSSGAAGIKVMKQSDGSVTINCTNGMLYTTFRTGDDTTGTSDTNTETSNGGASYIAGWLESWSSCTINSNWTNSGTITCLQINPWAPLINQCGVTTCVTVSGCDANGVCDAGSRSCTVDASNCPADAPRPETQEIETLVDMHIKSPSVLANGAYANNSDSNTVIVSISGSTVEDKDIVGWGNNGIFHSFLDVSNFPSDLINNTGRALNFNNVPSRVNIIGSGTNFRFQMPNVKSRVPFVRNGNMTVMLGSGSTTRTVISNIPYNFKKPFTGYIQTSEDDGLTWTGNLRLGTEMRHKLLLAPRSTLSWNTLSSYSLNDFSSTIESSGIGLDAQSKKVIFSTLTNNTGAQFMARINSSANATTLNQTPGLQINLPIVTYTFGGEIVRYKLSENDNGSDTTPIKRLGIEFLGLRVIGGIQGGGKSEFTGQKANISNIATSEMRTALRRNAYDYTRAMKSGDVLNGVKYMIGDVTISGDQAYETLVVKDGNVIISGDLNPTNKKLGIMVLKDGYNMSNGYMGKGNIYIKSNVKKINAVIYADGGVVSVDSFGIPYLTDSSNRTYDLRNQLFMNGSLFTRNTIGGSILAGGKYTLPGGNSLNDTLENFNIAMQYDLNYIRRSNVGCDKNSNNICIDAGEYRDAFVIKYDSRIISSPVKLFSK